MVAVVGFLLMSKVDELEQAVRELSPEDLSKFREWFVEFDSELWERQLERDVAAGRLDGLVEEARNEHREGRTRPL
jgi:hypothetical protein